MPQDRFSGAEADEFGREFGRRIAAAIGAEMLRTTSNECLLNGERMVIKCARKRTQSVGVSYKMMERIKAVLGAFEQDDGSYAIWKLSVERYSRLARPSVASGAAVAGKLGQVEKARFEREGDLVGTVRP